MTTLKRMTAVALASMAGWTPLQAQEPAPQGGDCGGGPVAVVAHVLRLTPEQRPVLVQALHEREQTLAPIVQGIAMREARIRELIASGGNPAEIGVLAVEIHHLRQQAEAAQAVFLSRVEALLDAEQRALWQQVRMAAQLQTVVPAFQALRIL